MKLKKSLMKIASFLFSTLLFFSCQQVKSNGMKQLEGTWTLINYEGASLNCSEPFVTLKITKSNTYEISGGSFINRYFSSAVVSEDGTFLINAIGSTRMGGSPELLACESTYFKLLEQTQSYRISKGQLYLKGENATLVFSKK